ncbi:MAG: hypothetical protein HFI40_08320 [Lachnospiraceae bacterium]|jgi:hypothetical protein|nr:hypothetical protein [Lachnospiraceae bacterium]MCX4316550.1 hypothetical protein [Lachnospiraceae bacterium]
METNLHCSPIYSVLFYMYHQTEELTLGQLEDTVEQGWITADEKNAILAEINC